MKVVVAATVMVKGDFFFNQVYYDFPSSLHHVELSHLLQHKPPLEGMQRHSQSLSASFLKPEHIRANPSW